MNIRIENWKLIVLSAFYFVFAFVSYSVLPQEFLSFFKIAGIAIIIAGGLQILVYFLKKDYMRNQDFTFSMGLLFVFIGLIIAFKSDLIVNNYRSVFSGAVVLDSILRLQYSMNLLRISDKQWKLHTLLAVIPLCLGMVLILFDLGGWIENYFSFLLIIDGIANVYTVLYYRRIVKSYERIDHFKHDETIDVNVKES